MAATDANRKIVEQERQAHLRNEAKQKGEAEDLSKLLTGVTVTIAQKAGENDQLFGSVTSKDVADALAAKNFTIDRRKVLLDEPIKQLGRVQGAGEAAQGRHRRSHRTGGKGRVGQASGPVPPALSIAGR